MADFRNYVTKAIRKELRKFKFKDSKPKYWITVKDKPGERSIKWRAKRSNYNAYEGNKVVNNFVRESFTRPVMVAPDVWRRVNIFNETIKPNDSIAFISKNTLPDNAFNNGAYNEQSKCHVFVNKHGYLLTQSQDEFGAVVGELSPVEQFGEDKFVELSKSVVTEYITEQALVEDKLKEVR